MCPFLYGGVEKIRTSAPVTRPTPLAGAPLTANLSTTPCGAKCTWDLRKDVC